MLLVGQICFSVQFGFHYGGFRIFVQNNTFNNELQGHPRVLYYWYIFIDVSGYFIVNYDEKNWMALAYNIMELPPLTRAQLISDSMDLARANVIGYDIPLKMIARMAVQDSNIMIIPTIVALNKLKFLNDILIETPAYGLFEVSN